MERARRIELGCVAASLAVAGAISVLAEPFPPLAHEVASDGWTRGIEFVLLVLVQLMLLSAIGVVHARIGVGLDGMTAERLVEAADEKQGAIDGLRQDLRHIHQGMEQLTASVRDMTAELSGSGKAASTASERSLSGQDRQPTLREDGHD